jgi:hypothetical protein
VTQHSGRVREPRDVIATRRTCWRACFPFKQCCCIRRCTCYACLVCGQGTVGIIRITRMVTGAPAASPHSSATYVVGQLLCSLVAVGLDQNLHAQRLPLHTAGQLANPHGDGPVAPDPPHRHRGSAFQGGVSKLPAATVPCLVVSCFSALNGLAQMRVAECGEWPRSPRNVPCGHAAALGYNSAIFKLDLRCTGPQQSGLRLRHCHVLARHLQISLAVPSFT